MFYLIVTLLQQPCKQTVKKSKEESRIINFQRITDLKCHGKNRVKRQIGEPSATGRSWIMNPWWKRRGKQCLGCGLSSWMDGRGIYKWWRPEVWKRYSYPTFQQSKHYLPIFLNPVYISNNMPQLFPEPCRLIMSCCCLQTFKTIMSLSCQLLLPIEPL